MNNLAGGSHARESVWEAETVHKIGADCPSPESASYAALAAVGAEGIHRMKWRLNTVMLITRLGMLGQMTGRLAQIDGLKIIGANRSAWKREAADAFGFDVVCEPTPEGIRAALKKIGEDSITFAVDTTGRPEVVTLCLSLLGRFSEITLLGYYPEEISVNFDICHGKNTSIHNPVGPGGRTPEILSLVESGAFNIESLIRHRVRPNEITEFYGDLLNNHSDYLGAVITW